MSHLILEYSKDLNKDKGRFTSAEIARQPNSWGKVWSKVASESQALTSFLKDITARRDLNIVLTGAGSSAFVGDAVASSWHKAFSRNVQAIPTTDLVTHFEQKILTNKPLLLISFARSGNSPESTAAVHTADRFCDEVYHLMITCNPDGKLAARAGQDNGYAFLLPPEAEDQSLAMTNSFTSMALAAVLIANLFSSNKAHIDQQVQKLSLYGQALLDNHIQKLVETAQSDFNRIIFLGSGPLWGIARESHLKVQELTNGEVVGKFDSFLGFRHGPKAVIDDDTLLVYLLSNDPKTRPYENDLMEQISGHSIDLTTLAVAETDYNSSHVDINLTINNNRELDEELWAIFCALPDQIIGFYKSLSLSYNPDNPSPDGTISRVVEGVTIYDENQ